MAWNYRKRIKIAPGVHLNFSKGGVSTSIGPKGAKINIGKNGTYLHTGIPGTGLYSRQKISGKNNRTTEHLMTETNENEAFFKPKNTWGCVFRWLGLIAILFLVVNLSLFITGFDKSEKNYNMLIGYGIVAAIFIIVYFKRFTTFLKRKSDDKTYSEIETLNVKDINSDTELKKESSSPITNTDEKKKDISKNASSVITKEILGSLLDDSDNDWNNLLDNDCKNDDESDPLFNDVAHFIVSSQIGSTSSIQRKFSIGFNRAVSLIKQLERKGIVGPHNGAKPRVVLVKDSAALDIILFSNCKANITKSSPTSREFSAKPHKNPIKQLNELIGLDNVKTEVNNLTNLVKIQKVRESRGLKTSNISYHCVFTGNPGTGKTTVARIIANIYKQLGVLKKGHLVETDRSGLVAEYVGQTAPKTNAIIDSAIDGVLFIDEAYSLVQGGQNDYGKEAIATLLKRMEDNRDRLVVILAGYSKEMEEFINSNSGLQSRFNRYINFPDYSKDELLQIFQFIVKKNDFTITNDALASVDSVLNEVIKNKNEKFGNARYVRNLFENIITQQANRLSEINDITNEMLSKIELIDIEKATCNI